MLKCPVLCSHFKGSYFYPKEFLHFLKEKVPLQARATRQVFTVFEYFCRNLLCRKQWIASISAGPPRFHTAFMPGSCISVLLLHQDIRKGSEVRDLAHRSAGNCTNLTLGVMQDLFLVCSRLDSVITHNIATEEGNLTCISVCFK